jgi:protein involved in sex pheromone biosynthesis
MARPRIDIDREQFEKLCSIQCTINEIAGYFNCSVDTIERWCKREYKEGFADIYDKKRGVGKISLRRSQFRMAETNPTMAIWLGKQYLGQKDSKDIEISAVNIDDSMKAMDSYFKERVENESEQETDS